MEEKKMDATSLDNEAVGASLSNEALDQVAGGAVRGVEMGEIWVDLCKTDLKCPRCGTKVYPSEVQAVKHEPNRREVILHCPCDAQISWVLDQTSNTYSTTYFVRSME